jgi:hypothetical protein
MRGPSSAVLWLLRRLTGLRLYHVFALLVMIAAALGAMAVAFWWLGEQADATIGPLGFVIVALAYLWAAMLLLATLAIVVGRVVLGRIRPHWPAARR